MEQGARADGQGEEKGAQRMEQGARADEKGGARPWGTGGGPLGLTARERMEQGLDAL